MTDVTVTQESVLRPIIGIENRTAQEVFDIMCDRFRHRANHVEGEAVAPAQDVAALVSALRFYACDKKCPWEKTRQGERCIVSHEGHCGYTARTALAKFGAKP